VSSSRLFLLGRPKQVMTAVSSLHYTRLTCEDQASIVCQMPGGAIANIWCSRAADDPTSGPWSLIYNARELKVASRFLGMKPKSMINRAPG